MYEKGYWETKDKKIKIEDMSNLHLINAINYLKKYEKAIDLSYYDYLNDYEALDLDLDFKRMSFNFDIYKLENIKRKRKELEKELRKRDI